MKLMWRKICDPDFIVHDDSHSKKIIITINFYYYDILNYRQNNYTNYCNLIIYNLKFHSMNNNYFLNQFRLLKIYHLLHFRISILEIFQIYFKKKFSTYLLFCAICTICAKCFSTILQFYT